VIDSVSAEDRLYRIRHSLAHVLAQAVLEQFPQARLGIGPPIDTGFYYDFDLGTDAEGKAVTFTPEDLVRLETRMREILAGSHDFRYREISADEARRLFERQPLKIELIDDLMAGQVDEYGNRAAAPVPLSVYEHDTFVDLCRGPHVPGTGEIPHEAFKLLSVAGAYWRGDERRPMLQRIYGTAWLQAEDLHNHLTMLEEARKRDHRKLGAELDIFTFDDEIGPGLPLWLPNGAVMIEELEKLAKEMEEAHGYQRVRTPHLSKEGLFLRSGHLPYYAEDMYPPMELEGIRYYIKPMNCPFHHKLFAARPRSYRDLPIRFAEYGTCYRYEKSGQLFGLMRVRSMQMNDAHIYCSEEQFPSEFVNVVDLYLEYFKLLGIEKYAMRFSLHDQEGLGKKYVDSPVLWRKTEAMARAALESAGVPFYERQGEAAFYGPKIDVQIWSAIGKEFSLATNQVDFAVPARFDLTFTNARGEAETPLCIHRAPLSTHERMVGFLIEHFGGAFPVWLSPCQVRVIPIAEAHAEYGHTVQRTLRAAGVRAQIDAASDTLNARIRRAQLDRVPYMLVVGERERAAGTVAVRRRDGAPQAVVALEAFVTSTQEKIRSRAREL